MLKPTNYSEIIKEIAKQHNVTEEEVQRDMEAAIREAFTNPTPSEHAEQAKIPRKGDIPTPEEFIEYQALHLLDELVGATLRELSHEE